jgi:hypothetical protein
MSHTPSPPSTIQELDTKDPLNAEFWGCMHTLAQEELAKAQRRDADDRALHRAGGGLAGASRLAAAAGGGGGGGGGAAAAMPGEVRREIEALLAGQTHAQLRRMEANINGSLAAGEGDPDYWEAVLERLQVRGLLLPDWGAGPTGRAAGLVDGCLPASAQAASGGWSPRINLVCLV